jgi:hypothetical protein
MVIAALRAALIPASSHLWSTPSDVVQRLTLAEHLAGLSAITC